MVTFAVMGERGYLGSIVARRWVELGADRVDPVHADYIVNCIRPDDLALTLRWGKAGRLISPSTDAIAEDTEYATIKRAMERRAPGVVIRAGIVDTRHSYPVAYTNWTCNPLTPLEWADLAWELRDTPGLHVDGRTPCSRWFVATAVARVWGYSSPEPMEAPEALDRVQPSSRTWPPLLTALSAFHRWLG